MATCAPPSACRPVAPILRDAAQPMITAGGTALHIHTFVADDSDFQTPWPRHAAHAHFPSAAAHAAAHAALPPMSPQQAEFLRYRAIQKANEDVEHEQLARRQAMLAAREEARRPWAAAARAAAAAAAAASAAAAADAAAAMPAPAPASASRAPEAAAPSAPLSPSPPARTAAPEAASATILAVRKDAGGPGAAPSPAGALQTPPPSAPTTPRGPHSLAHASAPTALAPVLSPSPPSSSASASLPPSAARPIASSRARGLFADDAEAEGGTAAGVPSVAAREASPPLSRPIVLNPWDSPPEPAVEAEAEAVAEAVVGADAEAEVKAEAEAEAEAGAEAKAVARRDTERDAGSRTTEGHAEAKSALPARSSVKPSGRRNRKNGRHGR